MSVAILAQDMAKPCAPLCVHAGPAIAIGRCANDYTHTRSCGAWAGIDPLAAKRPSLLVIEGNGH